MKRMLVALGVLGFACAATPAAQAQEAEPGNDLKKLDVWIGDWAFEAQVKDSPSGTEWKQEGTGQFQQMGESFYVDRSKWKDSEGKDASGVFVYGYDPVEKKMLVHGFTSGGWRGTAVLTIVDETVTFDWQRCERVGCETAEPHLAVAQHNADQAIGTRGADPHRFGRTRHGTDELPFPDVDQHDSLRSSAGHCQFTVSITRLPRPERHLHRRDEVE